MLYYLRFIPPKTTGFGETVDAVSTDKELTLNDYREMKPELFEKVGAYTLSVSTGEVFNKQPEKKK